MLDAEKKKPRYAVVMWKASEDYTILPITDIRNKKMLYNDQIIDDLPFIHGKKPETGWEMHPGVVLKIGRKLMCVWWRLHDSPNIFLSVALKKDLEKEASNLIYNYTAGKGNSSPKSVTEEDLLDDQLQGSAFVDQNYQEKSEKDQAKKGKKTDGQKVKSSTSKKSQDLEEMAKDDDATVNLEGSNRWKRKMEEERVNNEKEIGKLRAKVARLEEKLIESREAQKLEETRNLKLLSTAPSPGRKQTQ